MTTQKVFKQLDTLYQELPETKCLKSSCASWCCTKLKSSVSENAEFMALPLTYAIEFSHIKRYLDSVYPDKSWQRKFNFSQSNRVCPFKDSKSSKCLIYPVRPISCRLYGRKLPPILWGMEMDVEQMKILECSDVSILEEEKVAEFEKKYASIWERLLEWSIKHFFLSAIKQERIFKTNKWGIIPILSFGGFLKLKNWDQDTFDSRFEDYWEKIKNLL